MKKHVVSKAHLLQGTQQKKEELLAAEKKLPEVPLLRTASAK